MNRNSSPTTQYQKERANYQQKLRPLVLERDGCSCVHCSENSELEVAHLIPVSTLRKDLDAIAAHDPRLSITLCQSCHRVFDGQYKIAPDLQPEMDKLMSERSAIEKELSASQEEIMQRLGKQMQGLFQKTEDRRHSIKQSIYFYLYNFYQIPHQIDPINALYSSVIEDFWNRHDFWSIPYTSRDKAKDLGLIWSRILKLWYAPIDAPIKGQADNLGQRRSDLAEHIELEQKRQDEISENRLQYHVTKTRGGNIKEVHGYFADILRSLKSGQTKTIQELIPSTSIKDTKAIRRFAEMNKYSLVNLGLITRLKAKREGRMCVAYCITSKGQDWLSEHQSSS